MEINVSGHYEIYKNGELVGKTDNLILDGYLTRFCAGSTDDHGFMYVGSGTTEPAPANVGLESFIYAHGATSYPVNGSDGVGENMAKYFIWTKSFSKTSFSHSAISEVGFRMHTNSTDPSPTATAVDSRALIRDLNGNPTSINKTSDDVLVITFRFRMQLPPSPISSEITIGSVKHTMTIEVLAATANLAWDGNDSMLRMFGAGGNYMSTSSAFLSSTQELQDDITALGVGTGVVVSQLRASSNNNQTVDLWWNFSQSQMVAGIKYISMGTTYNYRSFFALHFNPPITDTIARTVRVEYKITVVRGQESAGGYQSALTAMVLPSTITEIDIPIGAFTSRGRAVATPIGGKAPYTYAWTLQSAAGTPPLSADSATSASTTFSGTGASGNNSVETWRCTITDDNSDTAFADTVVDLTWVV